MTVLQFETIFCASNWVKCDGFWTLQSLRDKFQVPIPWNPILQIPILANKTFLNGLKIQMAKLVNSNLVNLTEIIITSEINLPFSLSSNKILYYYLFYNIFQGWGWHNRKANQKYICVCVRKRSNCIIIFLTCSVK